MKGSTAIDGLLGAMKRACPRHPHRYVTLARRAYADRRPDEAIGLLDEALEASDTRAEEWLVHLVRARILALEGEVAAARAAAAIPHRDPPKDPFYEIERAALLEIIERESNRRQDG